MGEWTTYFAVNAYNRAHIEERFPDQYVFEKVGLIAGPHGVFDDAHYFLENIGVIERRDSNYHYIATCEYSDVKRTIKDNLPKVTYSIVAEFLGIFLNWQHFNMEPDLTAFTIEPGCAPLFDTFKKEGYVRCQGAQVYWTRKARPMLEKSGSCYPKNFIQPPPPEKALIEQINPFWKSKIDYIMGYGDKIGAMVVLNHARADLGLELDRLDGASSWKAIEMMYPDAFEKDEKNYEPFLWKWYGPK